MGRGHQTDRQTDTQTSRLLDQLGPEGRVGEKMLRSSSGIYASLMKYLLVILSHPLFKGSLLERIL